MVANERRYGMIWPAVWVSATAVFSLLILGYVEFDRERTHLEENLLQTVTAMAEAVTITLETVTTGTSMLAASRRELIERRDFAALHKSMSEAASKAKYIHHIVLVDRSGQQLINTVVPFGTPLPVSRNKGKYDIAFSRGRPYVSDSSIGTVTNEREVLVIVPVVIGNETPYALVSILHSRSLSRVLSDLHLPQNRIATIFDGSGTVVARTRDQEKFLGHKVSEALLTQLEREPSGVFQNINLDNVTTIAAYYRSERTGYGVAIGVPRSLIVQNTIASQLLPGLVVVVAAISLLMAWYFAEALRRKREGEELLLAYVQQAPAALAMLDRELRYLAVSQRWIEDYSLGEETIIGRRHYEVFPDTPDRWKEAHRRALAGETIRADQDRFDRADGSSLWLRWHVRPWQGKDGEIRGLLLFSESITARKEAEDALKETSAQLKAAIDAMTDAVFISDEKGNFTIFNEAFASYHRFGTKAECAVTFAEYPEILDVFLPNGDLAPVEMWAVPRALCGEVATNQEYTLRRKDTGEAWIGSYSLAPIRNHDGKIIGSVVTGREITEEKKREKALLESGQRLRLALDAAQAGTWEWNILTQENFWSDEIWRLYGLEPGSCPPTYESWRAAVAPEDFGVVEATIADAVSRGEEFEVEWRVRQTGEGPARWLLSRGRPRRGPDGGITHYIGIVMDISERRVMEAELRNRERFLRALFESVPDGIVALSQGGVIRDMNPAARRILDLEARAVGDLTLDSLLVDSGQDRVDAGRRRELTARRADGSTFPMEIVVTDLVTPEAVNDATPVAIALIRDITEEKERARSFQQAERMRAIGLLTGGVAHDFNNLMTIVALHLELIKDHVAGEAGAEVLLAPPMRAVQRGRDLSTQLLAFARRQPLRPTSVDVEDLLTHFETLMARTIGEQHALQVCHASGLWRCLADPGQLETALLNLVVNSRHAMPGGGRIVIETANVALDEAYTRDYDDLVSGDYVQISVADEGVGMSPETLARIFEPFFTTRPVGAGSGLGLSQVFGFIKQSGGHVNVYSELDKGTTVKLYLPRASGGEADAAPLALPDGSISLEGIRVLCVEDDPEVRAATLRLMRDAGLSVMEADTPAEALALLDDGHEFDLLFTDVILPGLLSGQHLAEEMYRRQPSIRVLFTSGYTDNAAFLHGRLDRGALLLSKPYAREELFRMIRMALAAR